MVQLLLKSGADVKEKTSIDEWTALHIAAKNGHEQLVYLLLENGADIGARIGAGEGAVPHLAAMSDSK